VNPRLLKEIGARQYLGGMSHGAFWALRQAGVIDAIYAGRAVYYDVHDLDLAIERLRAGSVEMSLPEPGEA
jgi:hypothetical protein